MGNNTSTPPPTNEDRRPRTSSANVEPAIKFPKPFATEQDFMTNWPKWKENFLLSVHRIGHRQLSESLSNLLLNRMGHVCFDIFQHFETEMDKGNFKALLELFDQYYKFGNKRKMAREDPYNYINSLKAIAADAQVKDEASVVLQKLKKEIDNNTFNNAATHFLPKFTFGSDFPLLTFKEIAFIWKYSDECRNIGSGVVNCNSCGTTHQETACPAIGKRCEQCSAPNHLSVRCPRGYIFDCNYCGGGHRMRDCPAYDETCRLCNRKNHFSWKCLDRKVKNCRYCGQSHLANRGHCPAKDVVCNKCGQKGHVSFKCDMQMKK